MAVYSMTELIICCVSHTVSCALTVRDFSFNGMLNHCFHVEQGMVRFG